MSHTPLTRGALAALISALTAAATLTGASAALASAPAPGPSYAGATMTTIAGQWMTTGVPTAGPALSSLLGDRQITAIAPDGDTYIADDENETVEKVTPDGTLSIVAGIVGVCAAPTPGPAANSALCNPSAMTVDAAGDLYMADSANNVVEKVTPDGTLSVVAGDGTVGAQVLGPATNSPLCPNGLATDTAGDLFVSTQCSGGYVDEITPDGTLSVIAGDGDTSGAPPTFGGPATSSSIPVGPIAVDGRGVLYILDTNDQLLLSVGTDGILNVVAGGGGTTLNPGASVNATAAQIDPTGVATDRHGDVFLADAATVDELNPQNNQLTAIAGDGTEAGHVGMGNVFPTNSAAPSGGAAVSYPMNAYSVAVGPDGTVAVGMAGRGVGVVSDIVPVPAPAISAPAAFGLTPTSATLIASVDPHGFDANVVFSYGTDVNAETSTDPQDLGSPGAAQAVVTVLTGLQPNTTYHYQVQATSGQGTTTSRAATFTTPPTADNGGATQSGTDNQGGTSNQGSTANQAGGGGITVAPQPQPAAKAARFARVASPSLVHVGASLVLRSGLSVTCPAGEGACTVRLRMPLTASVNIVTTSRAGRLAVPVPVRMAVRKTITVPAGSTAAITVRLTSQAMALLRVARQIRTTGAVTASCGAVTVGAVFEAALHAHDGY